MNNRVLVLVSTYNGERYLPQQLDSILEQQNVEVSILVRDDGSKDSTMAILEEYSSKYSNVSYYQGENLGPCMSFFDLLKHADGYDYYAFSDQDDVWDNDKLSSALKKMKSPLSNLPLLYCSNLKVVDENLNFCRKAHQKSYSTSNRYSGLVDFYAVGCTEVFNQKAVDMTRAHIRKDCLMHDSWVFMICNFFGRVIYDNEAYINYRQHGHNVVGMKMDILSRFIDKIKRIRDKNLQPRFQNAKIIVDEFSEMMNEKDMNKLLKLCNYKNGVFDFLRLLFDFDIRSNSLCSDIRYRFLMIIREI